MVNDTPDYNKTCQSCKHSKVVPLEEPCLGCDFEDDRWEPKEHGERQTKEPRYRFCVDCRHEELEGDQEPCSTCIIDLNTKVGWEPKYGGE